MEHDEQQAQPDPKRRTFLKTAPFGALAVIAAGAQTAEAAPAPVETPAEPAPSGYRETEHIRKYYRTASYW